MAQNWSTYILQSRTDHKMSFLCCGVKEVTGHAWVIPEVNIGAEIIKHQMES